MDFEILISKYLDGELTVSEDKLLRHLIKTEPEVAETFASMVDTHLAMKEDAKSINPSRELLRRTEDAVMMKILSQVDTVPSAQKRKQTAYYYMATAAMLLIMFTSVLKINESNISMFAPFNNLQLITNNNTEESSIINESVAGNEVANSDNNSESQLTAFNQSFPENTSDFEERNIINSVIHLLENDILISENTDIQINFSSANTEYNTYESNIYNSPIVFSNDYSSTSAYEEILQALSPEYSDNRRQVLGNVNMNSSNLPEFYSYNEMNLKINNIQLNSSVGFGYLKLNNAISDNDNVVQYSQSISYSADSKNKIGMEFGYSEFQYLRSVNISGNAKFEQKYNTSGSGVEVPDPLGDGSSFVPPTVPIYRQAQLFWGSAFYERNLLEYSSLTVDGRIGLGTTNVGPLTYTRLTANYHIYSGLYLTAGSEMRLFTHNLTPNLKKSTGFSGYLIYGLQLKF